MSLARDPRSVRTTAQAIGDAAEVLVARSLLADGWTILGRNVRVGRAEIDILAIEPGPRPELVVVEVRWRRRRDFGLPEETVDAAKLGRLRAAGRRLRESAGVAGASIRRLPLRVDLAAVEPGGIIRHHRGVG